MKCYGWKDTMITKVAAHSSLVISDYSSAGVPALNM